MGKYSKSFSADREDIPTECPICGMEFSPITEFIHTDYYADGFRTVLMCDNGDCNFKKVLDYITGTDVEKSMAEELDGDEDDETENHEDTVDFND